VCEGTHHRESVIWPALELEDFQLLQASLSVLANFPLLWQISVIVNLKKGKVYVGS
jgi:hypothetical protein